MQCSASRICGRVAFSNASPLCDNQRSRSTESCANSRRFPGGMLAQSSRAALTSTFEEPPLRDSMFRTLGAVSGGAAAAVAGDECDGFG